MQYIIPAVNKSVQVYELTIISQAPTIITQSSHIWVSHTQLNQKIWVTAMLSWIPTEKRIIAYSTELVGRPVKGVHGEYLHVCIQVKYEINAARHWISCEFSAFLLIPWIKNLSLYFHKVPPLKDDCMPISLTVSLWYLKIRRHSPKEGFCRQMKE